ncbi:putative WEB family protein [Cocos nucifera]|uniref:Putative WEB family protein n=1 Tax=Cocos nucifera TaxID=13894 RepID=A0A8K0HZG9_COCNU|nr:putative WEB family protein [Cocos nucifera]
MATEQPEVDTARPFSSVKEAIAVFGERFLAGDAFYQRTDSSIKLDATTPKPIFSLPPPAPPPPKPIHSPSSSPPSYTSSASQFNQEREDELIILSSLRKLEAELEVTKRELMLVKERESETEIVVANLNKQLHKIMSKLAEMEGTKAAESGLTIERRSTEVQSDRWVNERTRDIGARFEYLPTLAQALSLGDIEVDLGGRGKRKVPKKKPIIPLIGDMFSRKKVSSDLNSSLYSQSYYKCENRLGSSTFVGTTLGTFAESKYVKMARALLSHIHHSDRVPWTMLHLFLAIISIKRHSILALEMLKQIQSAEGETN